MSNILTLLSPRPAAKPEVESAEKPPAEPAEEKTEEVKKKPIITKIFYRPPSRSSTNSTGSRGQSPGNNRMFLSNVTSVAKMVEAAKSKNPQTPTPPEEIK